MLPISAIQVVVAPSAHAATVCATTTTYTNNIKVEPVHGKVFYIDTGQGQNIDATYVGYKVTTNATGTGTKNLWVRVDSFGGGVVSLANPLDANMPLGNLDTTSKMSYFLLKASKSTNTAQSHVVHVYQGRPDLPGSTDLYQCTFSFIKVSETIKAKANKVTNVTASTTTLVLGSTLTVTTRGATGTIGNGSPVDGAMLWLSPASKSYWPTQTLRLESVSVNFYTSKNYRTGLTTYTDKLYIKNASGTPSAGSQFWYDTSYVFRILGSSATTATIAPVAQIASGTQIKHTDMGSTPTVTLGTNAISVKASVTKTANTSVTRGADNKTVVSYTINLTNQTIGSAITFDQVIDNASPSLTFKAGTAKIGGAAYPDPKLDLNGNWVFGTPITVGAATSSSNTTVLLTYDMIEKSACTTGDNFSYTNSATAMIGNYIVSSTTNTVSGVVANGTCGGGTIIVDPVITYLDPEVTTQNATSVTATGATLNGTVDPNGKSGLTTIFELSTDPTLASGVTNVSLSTNGTTSSSTTVYAISQSSGTLSSETTYYYRTKVGTGSTAIYGAIMSFSTLGVVGTPTATTYAASNVSTSAADMNGAIDPNLVSGGATAKFQYGAVTTLNGDGTCPTAELATPTTVIVQSDGANLVLTSSSPTDITYTLTGLTSGGLYCYRAYTTFAASPTYAAGNWVPFKAAAVNNQVITFPALINLNVGGTQTAGATADSSLAITYTSATPDTCSVNATTGVITAISGGTCTITASQPGVMTGAGPYYYPATPVSVSFQITGSVTLTYNVNGATSGSAPASQSVTQGSSVTTNNPNGSILKTNWSFAGWNTSADGLGTTYAVSTTFTLNSNLTLYAMWNATITYDGNTNTSGTVPSSQTSIAGNIALRSNTGSLAKLNYVFNGWNTAQNGTGQHYAAGATYDLLGNVTLYAEWVSAGNWRVTYFGQGSDGGTVPTYADVVKGQSYTVSSSLPTRTGWTFAGWNTASDYSGSTYVGGNSFTPAANVNLYAIWTGTLSYSSNGATSGSAPSGGTYKEGQTMPTAAVGTLVKTYNTFNGWNTAANGTGDAYLANTTSTYKFTGSMTLYAQWSPNPITVTFSDNMSNGTDNLPDYTQTISATVDTPLDPSTFAKTGYVFGGWATSSSNATAGTIAYADGATVNFVADTSLYAIWKSEITITYSAGTGGTIVGDSPQTGAYGATGTEVVATPNSGYYFTGWNTSSSLTANAAARTDTFPASSTTYTASFSAQSNPYLSWSNPTAITYGTLLSSTQLNAVIKTSSSGSTLTGTCDYSPAIGTLLNASGSSQTLSVTCTPDNTQYKAISGTVSITVNAKPITITADDKSKNYLASAPTFTFTVSASTPMINSDTVTAVTYNFSKDTSDGYAAYSTSTAVPTLAGVYVNTPSAATVSAGTTASNYSFSYTAGAYTINKIAQSALTFADQSFDPSTTNTIAATGGESTGAYSYAVTTGSCSIATVNQLTVPSSGSCTVTATKAADRNYLVKTKVATISLNAITHTITVASVTNGSISPGTTSVVDGGSQSFTITAASNYHITAVLVDGVSVGTGGTYSFTNVTTNHDISATFALDTHTITVTVGSNGSVTPGSSTVDHGTNKSFTISPSTGYHIDTITVDSGPVTASPITGMTYTFTNVTTNHSIAVTFAINKYTVTYHTDGATNATPTAPVDSTQYDYGATVTVKTNSTSLTKTSFNFAGWNENNLGTGVDHAVSSTFTITSNIDLYPDWEAVGAKKVTFKNNVAASPATASQTGTTTAALQANSFSNPGHTFKNWVVESQTSTTFADTASYDFTADITLVAEWTVNKYHVIYNGNGATGGSNPADQIADFDTDITTSSEGSLVKSGAVFLYWSTDSTDTDSSARKNKNTTLRIPANTVNLYAIWGNKNSRAISINSSSYTPSGYSDWKQTAPSLTSATDNSTDSDGSKTYSLDSGSSGCSVNDSGTVTFLGYGTCKIKVTISEGSNNNQATSSTVTFNIGKKSANITAADKSFTYGQSAPANSKSDSGFDVLDTVSTITYTYTNDLGTSSYNSTTAPTEPGDYIITPSSAVITGSSRTASDYNINYVAAKLRVDKAPRTLTIDSASYPGSSIDWSNSDSNLTSTANHDNGDSGRTYSLDGTSSGCSLSGTTISYTGAGTCKVLANIPDGSHYLAATSSLISITIGKRPQIITHNDSSINISAGIYTPLPSANTSTNQGGLGSYSYSIDTSGHTNSPNCSISGSSVAFTASGDCWVKIDRTGNTHWQDGTKTFKLTVNSKNNRNLVLKPKDSTYTDSYETSYADWSLTGPYVRSYADNDDTTDDSLKSYSTSTPSICSINSSTGKLTFLGAGNCIVSASIGEGANFNSANSSTATIAVGKRNQTITLNTISDITEGDADISPVTSTDATGLTPVITIDPSSSSVCEIVAGKIHAKAAGVCKVNSNEPGNTNWNSGSQVQRTFNVNARTTTPTTPTPNVDPEPNQNTSSRLVISYKGNGNNRGAEPATQTITETTSTVTVSKNDGNLEKTGYTLKSWNTQPDGSGNTYKADGSDLLKVQGNSVTLYAVWEPKKIQITYVNNDGTTTKSTDTYIYDGPAVKLPDATKYGYDFKGWANDPQGNTDAGNAGETIKPANDITVYGKWEEKPLRDVVPKKSDPAVVQAPAVVTPAVVPAQPIAQPAQPVTTQQPMVSERWIETTVVKEIAVYPSVEKNTGFEISGNGWSIAITSTTQLVQAKSPEASNRVGIEAGNTVTSFGSGFKPNSQVDIYVYSEPIWLGSVIADANGNYKVTLPMPAELELGDHTFQAKGVTYDDKQRTANVPITLLPATIVAVPKQTLKFDVYFTMNSYFLDAAPRADIKKKLAYVKAHITKNSKITVSIVGWVQPTRVSPNVMQLSKGRAGAVEKYLKQLGLKAKYIITAPGHEKKNVASSRRASVIITWTNPK